MNTLPAHYEAAILDLKARAQSAEPVHVLRNDQLDIFMQRDPRMRAVNAGLRYFEITERIVDPQGVVFTNSWNAPDDEGLRELFAYAADRRCDAGNVSPRPYQLGQACDGTISASVWTAFKAACEGRGLVASEIYRTACAYKGVEEARSSEPDWEDAKLRAQWQGGIALPPTWNEASLAAVVVSLHAINAHSVAEELEERLAGMKQPDCAADSLTGIPDVGKTHQPMRFRRGEEAFTQGGKWYFRNEAGRPWGRATDPKLIRSLEQHPTFQAALAQASSGSNSAPLPTQTKAPRSAQR